MMKFIDRMERMIKADAHGVLDKLEERSLLLKQYLREAELEIQRKQAELELLEEEGRRLDDDADRILEAVKALDEDIELALASDKEELARFAVRRLLPKREARQQIDARREKLADRRARLAERLEVQREQFEELRTRVRAQLAAAQRAEEHGAPAWAEACAAEEEVELELLRRRRVASSDVVQEREGL